MACFNLICRITGNIAATRLIVTTFSITTLIEITLSTTAFSITLRKCDTQHKETVNCGIEYVCRVSFMLSVTISPLCCIIMLSVVLLNVIAPFSPVSLHFHFFPNFRNNFINFFSSKNSFLDSLIQLQRGQSCKHSYKCN